MASTYIFVTFLVFLFVSLTLILGLGLASREEERSAEELGDGAAPARHGRSVEDLVSRLEGFIRKEAASVAAFVSAPSVGGLFDDASAASGGGGASTKARDDT